MTRLPIFRVVWDAAGVIRLELRGANDGTATDKSADLRRVRHAEDLDAFIAQQQSPAPMRTHEPG
jgi:hypothetical protein